MDWSDRMNAAVDYIEENLAGEIDFNKAAEKAACSTFHFQRVFFAINGLTPADYARRRKLTLAATELSNGDAKVIDVAMKYGYDSPNAFTRAFRQLHGITPQAARTPGVTLTAFPRISFHIELKGGKDMDYMISSKPAFDVMGISRRTPSKIFDGFVIDPETWSKFWQECWQEYKQDDKYQALKKLAKGKTGPVTGAEQLGVCLIERNMAGYSYAIGIEKTGETVPKGLDIIHIPAATWAIFESKGPFPGVTQDLEGKIFREWFPSVNYEHAPAPELEVYFPGDMYSKEYRSQVWMPVIKKK